MLTMPIRPAVVPQALKGEANGNLPARVLEQVDGRPESRWLAFTMFAAMLRALIFAARVEAGIFLTSTGRYRSLAEQWSIFGGSQRRYEPCTYAQYLIAKAAGRGKKWAAADRAAVAGRLGITIPDATYWRKIKFADGYRATAAVPGTSDHGSGCADDLAMTLGGKLVGLTASALQWLYANAHRFGLAWALKSEPWHVHCAVDTLPAEVLRHQSCIAAPVIARGAVGNYVIWLQAQLNNHGAGLMQDGKFGGVTEGALLSFQKTHNLPPTGTATAETWWLLGRAA